MSSSPSPNEAPAARAGGFRASRRGFLRGATAAGVLAAAPAAFMADSALAYDEESGRLVLPPATGRVAPFEVHVPEAMLRDLRRRLGQARLPERETVTDVSQGLQLGRMLDLLEYWRTAYDWRRLERRLNSLGQYRTEIDGLGIHFLHVRSRHADALPIVLCHGWPGSVVEFLKVIGPLTDPTAHGGTAADAFHVIIPSMPGFGFSDKPTETGWTTGRIAAAWATLVARLGYRRYVVQGGDAGGSVATRLGKLRPDGLLGVHVNFPEYLLTNTALTEGEPTPEERAVIAQQQQFALWHSGYFQEQATRPQTIGYALGDSPAGQAGWIYEKFVDWTGTDGHPERVLTRDDMLDDISLYWFTGTAASSARLYWEFYRDDHRLAKVDLPVGVSVFPGEIVRTPRVWAERAYGHLAYFNDGIPAGGHFAAFEQPRLFVEEVRAFARAIA